MKSTTSCLTYFRSYLKNLSLILLFITITACSSTVRTIKDTSERFYRPGFSVLSPQEAGWRVDEKFRTKLNFFKRGIAAKSSYVLIVSSAAHSINFDSEKEYMMVMSKLILASSVIPKRNKVLEQKISLAPKVGKYCLRGYIKMKDFGAYNKGKESYLLMKDYSLTCLHPDDKSQLVNIKYSYRYPRDANDKILKTKANKIIAGLQFEPLLKMQSQ